MVKVAFTSSSSLLADFLKEKHAGLRPKQKRGSSEDRTCPWMCSHLPLLPPSVKNLLWTRREWNDWPWCLASAFTWHLQGKAGLKPGSSRAPGAHTKQLASLLLLGLAPAAQKGIFAK